MKTILLAALLLWSSIATAADDDVLLGVMLGDDGRPYLMHLPIEGGCAAFLAVRPVRVLALNVEEGWVRDVSEIIAVKVQDVARREGQRLTVGTRAFIEAHSDPTDEQQMLPLWQ
jgi:hypothetical protein